MGSRLGLGSGSDLCARWLSLTTSLSRLLRIGGGSLVIGAAVALNPAGVGSLGRACLRSDKLGLPPVVVPHPRTILGVVLPVVPLPAAVVLPLTTSVSPALPPGRGGWRTDFSGRVTEPGQEVLMAGLPAQEGDQAGPQSRAELSAHGSATMRKRQSAGSSVLGSFLSQALKGLQMQSSGSSP